MSHLAGIMGAMPKGVRGRATCIISDCDSLVTARGWCGKHYARWRAHGDPCVSWPGRPSGKETTKACTRCVRVLPVESFGEAKDKRSGRKSWCRECERGRWVGLEPAERQRQLDQQRSYRAANAVAISTRIRHRHEQNPEKRQAWARAAYDKNPAAAKRRAGEWRRRNVSPEQRSEEARRRRALKRHLSVGTISVGQLRAKFDYWGNRCWLCGEPGTTVDHVKPLAKGGMHVLSNIRPACLSCNSGKRDRWPMEEVIAWQKRARAISL